jgi:HEAT repeat protein
MKRTAFLYSALQILAAAPGLPGFASQSDDAQRLRDELIKSRLENLDLKLRLARLEKKEAGELGILDEALGSEYPEVSAAAFRELSTLAEDRRKAAVGMVLPRFRTGGEAYVVQALAFLSRVPTPAAEEAILQATQNRSSAVRKAAASALKSSSDERAAAALVSLLGDPKKEVRIASLEALGVAKRELAVRPLLGMLARETDDQIVEKIVDALGAIGSKEAVEALLEVVHRTPKDSIRWSCINSLGKIGDRRAAGPLRAYLGPSFAVEVRQVAMEALGKMKDESALPALIQILQKDPDEKLRKSAAVACGLIASPGAAEGSLLPAYLAEKSEPVREALWAGILAATGTGFPASERLATMLLEKGRRAEADQVCTRLHGLPVDPALRLRQIALEESVALAAADAGDFRSALPHLRRIATLDPGRLDIQRRIAACYRDLSDYESSVKVLRELEAKLARGEAAWWENRMAILANLSRARDPEPCIEEASFLLAQSPPPLPEERHKLLEQTLRQSAVRLAGLLEERDEPSRKAALEALHRQGKRIILSLAQELEEAPKPASSILEAGSLITGIANDAAASPLPKAKAAAWRAWYEKSKAP